MEEKLIEIVGRDGKPQTVPASTTPWWEEDERLARETSKAFATGGARNGNASELSIRIKRFEV